MHLLLLSLTHGRMPAFDYSSFLAYGPGAMVTHRGTAMTTTDTSVDTSIASLFDPDSTIDNEDADHISVGEYQDSIDNLNRYLCVSCISLHCIVYNIALLWKSPLRSDAPSFLCVMILGWWSMLSRRIGSSSSSLRSCNAR